MRARVPSFLFGPFSLMLGLTSAFAAPTAADLTSDSPFLPRGATAGGAVTEGGAIELHGVMTTPEGTSFSIYDTAKKSAQWVRVNQAGAPFTVKSYAMVDGNDEVKVDYQGSTLTLALKTPKIGAARPAAVMANQFTRGGPPGSNPITQTVVVNPTPADEAARLQAVVDAVAARRAARSQAVQNPVIAPVTAPVAPQNDNAQRRGQNGTSTKDRPRSR